MLIVHKKNDVILYNWPIIGSIHLIWQMVGQYDVIFLDTIISFFNPIYPWQMMKISNTYILKCMFQINLYSLS